MREEMKIVQIIPSFEVAGAEIMCENLIYELIKLGHQVITVSMYNYKSAITDRLENSGVRITYLDKKPGFDLSIYKKISRILKKEKPDVVHTHLYTTKYVFPIASKQGIRVVHTIHSIATKENSFLSRKLNKKYFEKQKAIPVALSDLIKDTIVEEYGISEEDIPVIFNGINLSKCLVKNKYSYNGDFIILHIGRFSKPKNHMGLLRAFSIFKQRYDNVELWLIGDGEKKAEVERFIDHNNLNNSVRFLGIQKDVYTYLHQADIFTLPSNFEGIPMTLIEAMGTGLPIVATAVGGVPNMLDNNSALLVPVDSIAIADAFEKYYLDEKLRTKHGKNALLLSESFSAQLMAKEYVKVYSTGGKRN